MSAKQKAPATLKELDRTSWNSIVKFLTSTENPLQSCHEDMQDYLYRLSNPHKIEIWLAFSSADYHEKYRIRARIRSLGFMDMHLIDKCNADEAEAAKAAANP